MDPDVSRWSMDLLLRNSISVTETLIKKMLRATPLSDTDSRFKKTVLLTTLQDELSTATISESILETLEVLEELHRCDGSPISASMSAAYCATAVECTLKYLEVEVSTSNNPAYLNAVDRIWRGRVGHMEPSVSDSGDGSLLFSGELKRWKDEIEASLLDSEVMERLSGVNTRRDAIHKLKAFLAEAWAALGPCVLELAASLPVTRNKRLTEILNLMDDIDEPTTKEGDDLDVCASPPPANPQQDKVSPIEIQEDYDTATGAEKVDPSTTCTEVHTAPSPQVQQETLLEDPHATTIHLPSPKRKNISPLHKYEPRNLTRRRRPKKWSALEEDTLRNAVNKIGEGNWKLILNSHIEVFDERTTIDLKDKWRNMTRYGGGK